MIRTKGTLIRHYIPDISDVVNIWQLHLIVFVFNVESARNDYIIKFKAKEILN